MEKYEKIKFKALDWYYLGEENGKSKLLLKDVLDDERIKKYADDDFMYDGHDVRHQDTIRPFDWDKSYIKNTILPNFLKDLDIEGKTDLLTIEEIRALPENVRKPNDWYWSKSRTSDSTSNAFYVNLDGYVGYYGVGYNCFGVRPILYISSTQIFDKRNKIENLKNLSLEEKVDGIIEILKEMSEEENV